MPTEEQQSKPIILTTHVKSRMDSRGATLDEMTEAIRMGTWEPAKRGKWHATRRFPCDLPSAVNQRTYRWKTTDVVFAEDPHAIVVLTVKVYYHD